VRQEGAVRGKRWVRLSYDGRIVTGWASMAKGEDEARELVAKLKESGGA
jgi:hypothetical protein